MRPYLLLSAAVVFEVMWGATLRLSGGFTVLWATLLTFAAYYLSLVFLTAASASFNVAVVYVVWTGSASALVPLIGVLAFGDRLSPARAVGVVLVLAGVVVLLGWEPQS